MKDTWIEQFLKAEPIDVPGMVGDAYDCLIEVKEVEGGEEIYFCDDDYFTLNDKPTFTFWGNRETTRHSLALYLEHHRLIIALQNIAKNHPGSLESERWLVETTFRLYFKQEYVDTIFPPTPAMDAEVRE